MHSKARQACTWLARAISAVAIGLAVWCCPASALGQSLEVAPAQFRFKREVPRQSYPFWVNREDCQKDKRYAPGEETIIEVQPSLSPVGNYALQVWVSRGADCTDQQVRLTQGSCWKILDVIAQVNNTTYELSPREILAEGAPVDDNTCNKQVEWSPTIFFLLFDGDTLLANTKWKETQVDTKAPPPPSNITASGGDNAIFLTWGAPLEQQVIDAQGFAYYCADGGMEVIGQAGASGTGGDEGSGGSGGDQASGGSGGDQASGGDQGSGGSGGRVGAGGSGGSGTSTSTGGSGGQSTGVTCAASGLTPGAYPDESTRCGSVGSASARNGVAMSPGQADSQVVIENGTTYGVGIAALDRVGNVGILSTLTCATPEPVVGFFEQYKNEGGRAGGGFCAIDRGPRQSHGAAVWALALGLLALRRLRVGRRQGQREGEAA